MKVFLTSFMMCILIASVNSQEFSLIKDKRVKKIKILSSSSKDVDKIFGRHIPINEPVKVKGGVINIIYSFGKCSEINLSKWDVASNIVVGVDFYPSKEIRFDSLKVDLSSFILTFESMHDLPLFSYSNDEIGVKYVINKLGSPIGHLHSVEYYPSDKFNNLKCKKFQQ